MSSKNHSIASQFLNIANRLDKLENTIKSSSVEYDRNSDPPHSHGYCSLPDVPARTFGADVSSERARLLRWVGKKWINGTKLHYYFFESGPYVGESNQMVMVREAFEVWKNVGIGISFEEVSNISDAEVRIGFRRGDGAWSYVGRDVIDVPGQYERTMNFGWDLTTDPRGVDTPVHEIGHTLGFPHEHQNPISGIVWDEEAVYAYFGGSPNFWSREDTYRNVLAKVSNNAIEGSEWDPDSIMHYGFPGGLIVRPPEYSSGLQPALGLSGTDIAEVRHFYPPITRTKLSRLVPFGLELLTLEPAEQKDFVVEPEDTREYTIQTFGSSDTVMVLFEDRDGDLKYLDGDDDSGSSLNSKIAVWLRGGARYVLRIRLYLNYAGGDTAVLMW